jgi:PAS domain S-box-containing protein
MENQIQTFVIVSSVFLGFFILITVYLVVKLKLNDIALKKSEEKLKVFNETLQDIVTERTKKLRKSEREYRLLYELHKDVLENSPAGIMKLNKDLEIEYCNPEMSKILNINGNQAHKSIGKNLDEIEVFDNVIMKSILNDLSKGYEISREVTLTHNSDNIMYVILNCVPVFEDKQFSGAVLLANDITQLKKAEQQIMASLKEKEVLLKELHHRVKNNMQIISSMLKLQLDYIKDPIALEFSRSSHNRVKTMALVHEKLYNSNNLAKIDFAEYVRSLTVYLLGYYRINTNRITIKSDIQDVLMDINMAIPCGLIINELFSNSLKHAFPDKRKGFIEITFKSNEDENILIVMDNGVGLPPDIDITNPSSLGLQLMNALVQQLHGNIEFSMNEFTKFQVSFSRVFLSTYSGIEHS